MENRNVFASIIVDNYLCDEIELMYYASINLNVWHLFFSSICRRSVGRRLSFELLSKHQLWRKYDESSNIAYSIPIAKRIVNIAALGRLSLSQTLACAQSIFFQLRNFWVVFIDLIYFRKTNSKRHSISFSMESVQYSTSRFALGLLISWD